MFQVRPEQYAAMRRKRNGDALIATLTSPLLAPHWDESKTLVYCDDPLGNRTTFGFDSQGFTDRVSTPLGRTWQLVNRSDGKTVQVAAPSGHLQRMDYAGEGSLIALATSTKQPIRLHYTTQRAVSAIAFSDGTAETIDWTPWHTFARVTDRLGAATTFNYNVRRNVTGVTDGNGNTTQFHYGGWSRPQSTQFPNGTAEHYSYDQDGFLAGISNSESAVQVKMNDKGKPLLLRYSDGTEIAYQYDDKQRIVEAKMGDQVTKLTWNDFNQVTEEVTNDLASKFDFDEAGRLSKLTLATGETIGYAWDADSRLTSILDWNGEAHNITYAASDGGYIIHAPNGTASYVAQEPGGKQSALNVVSQYQSVFSLAYSYDSEERIAGTRDSAFGDRAFSYDATGQLLAQEGANRNERFTYDGNGNPTSRNGALVRVDAFNQMLQSGDEQLSYDARGNVVRRSNSHGTWQYGYDARNLMTVSRGPSGETTVYTYDAFGRRLSKRTGSRETRFQWLCEHLVGELAIDHATGITRRQDYLYFPWTYTPMATRIDGRVYSCHADFTGKPRAMTGPDGALAWLADYTAFGHADIALANVANPLRLPGQYYDEETGFHYNRFRYYSPEWGRYSTRDPIGFLAGTNFYRYANNDPINGGDPLGLWTWTGVAIGVGIGLVAAAAGVAVVATCGLAGPAALLVGGMVAGAVAGGLGEAVSEKMAGKDLCASCIIGKALLGAAAGAVAAIPLMLGAAAGVGVAAMAALGGLSGAIGYMGSVAGGTQFTWTGLGVAVGIGAVSAGLGSLISPASGAAAGAEGGAGGEGAAAGAAAGDSAPSLGSQLNDVGSGGASGGAGAVNPSAPSSTPSSTPASAQPNPQQPQGQENRDGGTDAGGSPTAPPQSQPQPQPAPTPAPQPQPQPQPAPSGNATPSNEGCALPGE